MKKEGQALLSKWGKTGLLEGLQTEHEKSTMARLLEKQAKELLRESSSMSAGDVEGFAAVAFPIVRRVFAGLIANDLVSVQPMSLPSGLIFFLDFSFDRERLGNSTGQSLYGGDKLAKGIADGVTIDGSSNIPGSMPVHASELYAKNITAFLTYMIEDGDLKLNLDDEIISGSMYTHQGEITHEPTLEALKI